MKQYPLQMSLDEAIAIESLILSATNAIAVRMDQCGVDMAELARRIGRTPLWVKRVLNGSSVLTLGMLAQIMYALDEAEVEVKLKP